MPNAQKLTEMSNTNNLSKKNNVTLLGFLRDESNRKSVKGITAKTEVAATKPSNKSNKNNNKKLFGWSFTNSLNIFDIFLSCDIKTLF